MFGCTWFSNSIHKMVIENEEEFFECRAPFLSVFGDGDKETLARREDILQNVLNIKTLSEDFIERLFKNQDQLYSQKKLALNNI